MKRVFWNTFNFGTNNTTSPDQLKIDVGVYNSLLGKGYGEIASESRSMHKSQGFGSAKTRGTTIEYFKLLKGDSVKTDLFEGIDQTWKRLGISLKIEEQVNKCIKKYDPSHPEKILPDLLGLYRIFQMEHLKSSAEIAYWIQLKIKETENIILACSGLWMEAYASDYIAIPGNDISITTQIVYRNKADVKMADVKLNRISFLKVTDTTLSLALKQNELYTFLHKEKLSDITEYSNPYWLNRKHDPGRYNVKEQQLIGTPENDPVTKVVFDLSIGGIFFKIERNIVYKYTDPVKGEVYRPLEILPPATVNISENVFVWDVTPRKIQFTVKANMPNVKGKVQVEVSKGWKIDMENLNFDLKGKNDETIVEAVLTPLALGESTGNLKVSLSINQAVYNRSIKRIEYDHIPYQIILSDAEADLVKIDIVSPTKISIGYIPGPGDEVVGCLKQLGYEVTILTDELLTKGDLSKYSTIITGVRAYNTNLRLQVHYDKLMAYVQNGGNLIVQYNTNSRVGPLQTKIGPYPFTISRDRVTNEKAEVRFVKPDHSVLNYPNKITAKDFEGWVQERGIYFATDLDKNYETVFSMNDLGDKPSEGSLIITKYGKGNFVYTGLAFFRELPAGVPGAYRLFVNLLSLPVNK